MKRMLYVTGLLLCTSLGGYAQEGNLIDVKVVNEEVKKQGSEVSLRMTLDLTGLRVGNQKSVCLHPAVVSADGTHEAVLAPVVVDGKPPREGADRSLSCHGQCLHGTPLRA